MVFTIYYIIVLGIQNIKCINIILNSYRSSKIEKNDQNRYGTFFTYQIKIASVLVIIISRIVVLKIQFTFSRCYLLLVTIVGIPCCCCCKSSLNSLCCYCYCCCVHHFSKLLQFILFSPVHHF